jgi:hypothetical protein
MMNDPPFRACVEWMIKIAKENAFTPGELKQMAFYASLQLEMRSTSKIYKIQEGKL